MIVKVYLIVRFLTKNKLKDRCYKAFDNFIKFFAIGKS